MADHAAMLAEQLSLVVRSWSMCPIEEFEQHVEGFAEIIRPLLATAAPAAASVLRAAAEAAEVCE